MLARSFNVASFVSIRSGREGLHHVCLPDVDRPLGLDDALTTLLNVSRSKSVNVRTFTRGVSKGLPFIYGLNRIDEVRATLDKHLANGLHCIVNETVDTHDGGVSGVTIGDLVEFVNDDTPRGVESVDVASFDYRVANKLLGQVYGSNVQVPTLRGQRVEFSVHPYDVGVNQEQVLVWETELSDTDPPRPSNAWPNRFSRLIGDKTFGLLVADAIGLNVPRTLVIGRRLRPFSFGRATGSSETWMRTAPSDQAQGKYTTTRGWVDVFALLSSEDPFGQVAAILSQDGVDAQFSGAAISHGSSVVIEGVAGFGDDFMLGVRPPASLPKDVIDDVQRVVQSLADVLRSDVSIEWAADSSKIWVLQSHVHDRGENAVLVEGAPVSWVSFAPSDGLEKLRRLLKEIEGTRIGVLLTEPVGRTSHVGDLLRATQTPARYVDSKP